MFRAMRPLVTPCTLLVISLINWANVFAVPPLQGDIDADGDVDNSDLAIIASNDGINSGATLSDGDVDADGDVDSVDFDLATTNFSPSGFGVFFGAITSDPNGAQLLYNFASGEVFLDQINAPGGVISTFILQSNPGSFVASGTAVLPFGGGLFEDETSVIAQSDPDSYNPAPGFSTNPHNLGAILPISLDLAGLTSQLSQAVYVGLTGTGVRDFHLVVIPEPSTPALALAATLILGIGRRRKQT